MLIILTCIPLLTTLDSSLIESVVDFVTRVQTLARPLEYVETQLVPALMNNVLPHLKAEIIRHRPTSLQDFIEAAKLAENVHSLTVSTNTMNISCVQEDLQALKEQIAQQSQTIAQQSDTIAQQSQKLLDHTVQQQSVAALHAPHSTCCHNKLTYSNNTNYNKQYRGTHPNKHRCMVHPAQHLYNPHPTQHSNRQTLHISRDKTLVDKTAVV